MKKYKYNINNLDCPNCARKIEDELKKHYSKASVNFSMSQVIIECEKECKIKEINKIIKSVEPDASIDDNKEKKEYHIADLIIGIVICLLGYYLKIDYKYKVLLYIISYILLLNKTFIKALKILIKSKRIDENLLIVISCIGALCLGEVLEGMMVISLYLIGKILEEKAVNNSRKSISDLINLKESYANKKINNEIKKVSVEDLNIGDIIVIKKGEKVPVDGVIIKGETKLDDSALTGENAFKNVKINDNILSGSINLENVIEMKVLKNYTNSTVNQILSILEDATDKKSKVETTVNKFSKIYTPLIIISAILIIIVLPIFNVSLSQSIYRALTFLVISCPCAIAISVPLSYFTGLGVASRNGILIKGSNYLDNVSNAKNIIFDKTGTLTRGEYSIENIEIVDKLYNKEEIINILVNGEKYSNHPIASAVSKLNKTENLEINNYKEIDGKGIYFEVSDKKINIGNKKICNCNNIADVHINIDNKHVASIKINDGLKENARDVIKKIGLNTYMFTGDKEKFASEIGKKLGIYNIESEMLPVDKYKKCQKIQENGLTIFVGDGINDAPVLNVSDIGISMGNIGSEIAIEASDIVIMNDDLNKIVQVIEISKYTKKIIKQNLIFALFTKFLILLLSIFGFATMYLAVFADTGVTLITILNTLRIKKYK